MSEQSILKLNNELVEAFYEQNPNFDILNFDCYAKEAIFGLNMSEDDRISD